jgi:hypothetical protein
LSIALASFPVEDHWHVVAMPGTPIVLERDGETCNPFAAIQRLGIEDTTADARASECLRLGITGRPLVSPAAVAVASPAAPVVTPTFTAADTAAASRIGTQYVHCWRRKHLLRLTAENRGMMMKCPGCGTTQRLPR